MDLTEPDEHGEDIFHPEPVPRRRTSAARAMAVIAIALVVAALLDADGLRQTADRQPPGRTRDMAVWVTKHVVQPVSHAFGFNQPRHWINDALGVDAYGVKCTGTAAGSPLKKGSDTVGTCSVTTAACASDPTNDCVTVSLDYLYKDNPMLPNVPGVGLVLPSHLVYQARARVS